MKPTIETLTAAMPWYEPEDYAQLWQLAADRDQMPSDYDVWHKSARAVFQIALAQGRAIQMITIRPAPFLEWLGDRPNIAAARLRYVEERAGAAIKDIPV